MSDTIPALHAEAQAIRDDMAQYGLDAQNKRTGVSWNTKVEEWKIRLGVLRDRITPHVGKSASIKAARAGAEGMYVRLFDYQKSPAGYMNDLIADWAKFIRIHIRDKLI